MKRLQTSVQEIRADLPRQAQGEVEVALEVRVVALAVSGAEEDQVALLAEGPAAGAWTWTR
jgi:hypothetical protein